MAVIVDRTKFDQAHEAFLKHMLKMGEGVPFTGFGHSFFREDEWEWKHRVRNEASEALQLKRWATWRRPPGKIIQAVKNACTPGISRNLLEHRYGSRNSSEAPLYRVEGADQVEALESQLFDFFRGGEFARDKFAPRFDSLAHYLRSNHLGCKWPFIAYLAFLACPERYFPVMSSHFDGLLSFYGVGERVAGRVTWDRYSILLVWHGWARITHRGQDDIQILRRRPRFLDQPERGGSRERGPFLGALPGVRYRPVAEPPQSGKPASV